MPAIEKLHKAYKDKGLVVLGVNKEEPEVVREFYKKNDVTFPTATDKRGEVFEHYGVTGIPTTVIYDRKGKIVAQFTGTRDEQQFLRLLKKAGLAALPVAAATKWDKKVDKTAVAVRAASARAPAEIRADSTIRAAELLRATHPQLAWQFAVSAAEQLKAAGDKGPLNMRAVEVLIAINYAEGERVARANLDQATVYAVLIRYWMNKDDPARAAEVLKEAWRNGVYMSGVMSSVLMALHAKHPQDAAAIFREFLDPIQPGKAPANAVRGLLTTAEAMAPKDPAMARAALAKLLDAVSREDFNREESREIVATYRFGSKSIETAGTRDSFLLRIGIYLHALAPDLYSKNEKLFEKWREDIAKLNPGEEAKAARASETFMTRESLARWSARPASPQPAPPPKPAAPPKPAPFAEAWAKAMSQPEVQRMSPLYALMTRNDLTETQQTQAIREVLHLLPKIPVNARYTWARMAFQVASEHELKPVSKPAARAFAAALADLQNCNDPICESLRRLGRTLPDYDQLAESVKRSKIRVDDPAVAARVSLIDLQDVLDEKYDFKLAGIHGGDYALKAQKGRVVMLNFWATW